MKKLVRFYVFYMLWVCLSVCVYAQDAGLPEPLSLSQSIISNLQQLRQLNTELMNESLASKESSLRAEALMKQQDEKLAASENLVKQLSMLVDDQVILYRKHLTRLRLYLAGLIGLVAAYTILKAGLRLKFKIKIW
jgi:hypothetical protein